MVIHLQVKYRDCIFVLLVFFTALNSNAQQAFLKFVSPAKNQNNVVVARQFITGTTCKECIISLNQIPIKVWPTGAFAAEVNLTPGDTSFLFTVTDKKGFTITQKLFYQYSLPPKEKAVETNTIAYWRIEPQGDLLLKPGDKLKMTIKAIPGAVVKLSNGFELKETAVKDSNGVKGIYKGDYIVKENDDLIGDEKRKLKATISLKNNEQFEATSVNSFAVMQQQPTILYTKGKLPYLLIGLGEDRLGGTKIGYLDSMVKLHAVSKVGDKYCVQLTKHRQAYIEEQHVQVVNNGSFSASSLTGSMRVWGDSLYDYISLGLTEKLPYQSFQQINPSTIVVDVFGATANTNWITQLKSVQEIKQVSYEQTEDELFRITIQLQHVQHWGHTIYYTGNNLVIRIKHQPKSLLLQDMIIGVDAGHGGSNKGAFGITGIMEKEMTLLIAKELQQALEAEGATVIMSRTTDETVDNHDRYTFFKARNPNLLVSIHLNSSADPIRIKGVSTYYKHIGYRLLTQTILHQMLDMGLQEFGNVGNFNFILNGFTEFPNVLVETLFISHPEDESNVLTKEYRKQMAGKIVLGIKDWLQQCNNNQ
jgi:N-acetylmuramoyl-L-alanine amidase